MCRNTEMTAQRVSRLTSKAFLRLIEIEKGKYTKDLMAVAVRGRRRKLKEEKREGKIVTLSTIGGRKQERRHKNTPVRPGIQCRVEVK